MAWLTAKALTESVPLPDGYRYELLDRSEIPALVRAVDEWFPGLAVGNASCYLREDFYENRVFLDGGADHDFFVLLFKRGDDWAGMLLVTESDFLRPSSDGMTPATNALFNRLYPGQGNDDTEAQPGSPPNAAR